MKTNTRSPSGAVDRIVDSFQDFSADKMQQKLESSEHMLAKYVGRILESFKARVEAICQGNTQLRWVGFIFEVPEKLDRCSLIAILSKLGYHIHSIGIVTTTTGGPCNRVHRFGISLHEGDKLESGHVVKLSFEIDNK